MEGIKREESVGVSRALIAALFLIFAVSLAPGLFGAHLGDLDAFVPEGTAPPTVRLRRPPQPWRILRMIWMAPSPKRASKTNWCS